MLLFISRAFQLVYLFEKTDVDYANVNYIAKQIVGESKADEQDASSYNSSIDESIAGSQCNKTLISLPSRISPKTGQ